MKYDFLCELCEQEHHILSVRFLFFFIAVSECRLPRLLTQQGLTTIERVDDAG